MKNFFYLLFILLVSTTNAQEKKCAASELLEAEIQKDPSLAARMQQNEKNVQEYIAANRSSGT
ncbi:MAG: hypothetical protein ACT4ON_02795, partial [Bacteroidota bacterium]